MTERQQQRVWRCEATASRCRGCRFRGFCSAPGGKATTELICHRLQHDEEHLRSLHPAAQSCVYSHKNCVVDRLVFSQLELINSP